MYQECTVGDVNITCRVRGQRDIRKLLIIGAMSVIRATVRKSPPEEGSWLGRMLAKKPRMLVAIALANKMARMIWAMLVSKEDYKVPAGIAARQTRQERSAGSSAPLSDASIAYRSMYVRRKMIRMDK